MLASRRHSGSATGAGGAGTVSPGAASSFAAMASPSEEFLSSYNGSGGMKRSDSNLSLNLGLDGNEGDIGLGMDQDDLEQDALFT